MSRESCAVILPQFDAVMGVLRGSSQERLTREHPRVQLAALKLAQGNFRRLRNYIDDAQRDYRDVLAAAEYPEYMKLSVSRISQLSRKERLLIINRDWEQYQRWLRGESDTSLGVRPGISRWRQRISPGIESSHPATDSSQANPPFP